MEIYLDSAATTKLREEAFLAMKPYLVDYYANPSSIYSLGQKTKSALELSRESIANNLGAKSKEIYFTSCATESINWALRGIKDSRKHIISTETEHHATLHTLDYLKSRGYKISYCNVNEYGLIDINHLKSLIDKDTFLVSLIYANNEIGTIEPIEEVGNILKDKNILFHVDGVQALGTIDFNLNEMPVDMMSFSSHKIRGPRGVGVLYVREGIKINPFIHGGAQERKKRAGTENVANIVGFAKALELSKKELKEKVPYIKNLRDILLNNLLKIDGVYLNGHMDKRLVGNINISIDNINIEQLLMMLDFKGICASSGSACTAGSSESSHVLRAIGRDEKLAKNCLRLSINEENTIDEITKASDIIKTSILNLRSKE